MKTKKQFTLKHGSKKIPVYIVSEEEIHSHTTGLQPGEFLFGLYKAHHPKIFLNQSVSNKFGTLIHEIGEYIRNEYGLEMTHEQLSVFSQVLAEIFSENKKLVSKFMGGSL